LLRPDRIDRTRPDLGAGGLYLCAACAALSVVLHIGVAASLPSGGPFSSDTTVGSTAEMVVRLAVAKASAPIGQQTGESPVQLPRDISKLPGPPKTRTLSTSGFAPRLVDESQYFTAKQLTVRPAASEYISVPYPKDSPQEGVRRTVLAIFINEDGSVAKVRINGTALPPAFEKAAIETFSRARYHAGRIGDRQVKSRMLVEVEFDSGKGDSDDSPRVIALPGKR
jgi:hypothetical protein